MKSNIFIPTKINVGFQNRNDTYTKKLAYVIYYDEKGKLRKEASWNSWRDEKIPNEEFENVPTSGFVINKKVGDYDSGWNHRHAYVRIYDPRNFEFEIGIENLLYILENTNSIKGKGLEGEFVYGWDGKDLVLIPTSSPDYKEIAEYNSILHNNETVKAKDLIIGATYLTKDNSEMVYMGKYDYYSSGYSWYSNGEKKYATSWSKVPSECKSYRNSLNYEYERGLLYGKYFWFAYKNYEYDYIDGERINRKDYKWHFSPVKSISSTKFIKCKEDRCTDEYADIYEQMQYEDNFSPYDKSKDEYCDYTLDDFKKESQATYSTGTEYRQFYFIGLYNNENRTYEACVKDRIDGTYILKEYNRNRDIEILDIFPTKKETIKSSYGWNRHEEVIEKMIPVSLDEIFKVMKPSYRQTYLKNGKPYRKENKNE